MTYRPAALLTLFVLAGCSSDGHGYPSLALRPVETRSWAEPVVAPPAPAEADPALDARIASIATALAAGGRAFDAADRRATPLVRAARGGAAGTEQWVAAESALAELDARRAAVSDAATTLEDLGSTRAQAAQPDYPALVTAQADAAAMLDREAARIQALQATIPSGG